MRVAEAFEASAVDLFSVITAAKVRPLEDERFFSVLDVALDIQSELDFGSSPILIPLKRDVIRYEVLYPVHSVNMSDRYCELRWKAAEFLQREGYLPNVKWRDTGQHRWQSLVEVQVPDATLFHRLVVTLTEEEERRQPGSAAEDLPGAMARLEQLGDRFHRVALRLANRYAKRSGLAIDDEYDVQDLLGALLETRFSDVRPEQWTPGYAGKQARVDFLPKEESVVVETKMTRDGLNDAKLGDELIIDIEGYKNFPGCKALFCFVYDPQHRLKRPDAIESDLSRKSDGLFVRTLVRPRR